MRNIGVLGLLLLLSACAASNSRNQTRDSIREEMNQAAISGSRAPLLKPESVDDALLPPMEFKMNRGDGKPTETRFDLTVDNTPASQVFMAIVSGTPYSMVLHPDVAGNISLNLKDVTVLEALETVREMYGYDYKLDGTRIFVQSLTLQTRIFQVNYLTGNRAGTTSVRVSSSGLTDTVAGSGGGGSVTQGTTIVGGGDKNLKFDRGADNSSKITTTTSADFWDELSRALHAIVGSEQGRSVVISPMSGVLVIRAMPEELKSVTAYLKASQISIERQVILEAKIIDVQLNDSYQSGVNWSAFKNSLNSHVSTGVGVPGSVLNPAAAGAASLLSNPLLNATPGASLLPSAAAAGSLFGLAFQTSNFAVLLNFLESQGDVHVLSSPRIATLNNQKAVLKVGTDAFFVTEIVGGSAAAVGVPAVAPSIKMQPFFSGIALDVTPRIDENNEIILHIHPSVSAVSSVITTVNLGASAGVVSIPLASSSVSETDSIVRARDGQIVAIGGLMRQESTNGESGLPGLSKSIFGQTSRLNNKRELVILIKPTVVDSGRDWSDDIGRSRDRIDALSKQIKH